MTSADGIPAVTREVALEEPSERGLSQASLGESAPAAIFDVDGTLCDVRPIRKYVVSPDNEPGFKRDFQRFHSESLLCDPHPKVVRAAAILHKAGFKILIVSGRENRFSSLTQQWLEACHVPFDRLYLRPDKDYRPDREAKWEIGTQIWKEYTPVVAFDDRNGIIKVWQQLGIATVKVGDNGDLGRLAETASSIAKQVAEILAEEAPA